MHENVLSRDLQFSYSFLNTLYTRPLMGFVVSWDGKIESDVYRYWMSFVRTHQGKQRSGDFSRIKDTHTNRYEGDFHVRFVPLQIDNQ